MKLFNFNLDKVNLNDDIITTYKNKTLILKNVKLYYGPVTMQYLPYGGIQSVYNYNLIINTKDGFITCSYVIYDNVIMSNKEFIKTYNDLVNTILPN